MTNDNAATKFLVQDLDLYYGKFQALKKINLDIKEKEITALIGPSGCGKSTFLKTLNRMNDLEEGVRIEGSIALDGKDIFAEIDPISLRHRVGMVFQQPNPFPKSIYDNVAYGPRIHGVTKKSELDEIVERSLRQAAIWDELKDRLNKSALGLSGGQQQRLCIARTLAVQPEVILMDEPTNHLDYIAKEALDDALKEFTGTLVTVSHDRYFLNCVPDKIIEMFPTGFNEYNGGYDYYLEHKKPEIVEKTVKADSENKAAYKENKKNKADDRKRRAKLLSLQREMDSLEDEIATLKAESEKPDVSSDYQKLSDILALIADKESCLEDAETEWLELSE